jgi:xylulokinase
MTEVTVGIDIGTTSVKAVAADGDGTVVGRARVPHPLRVPAPDRLEHDAAIAWRDGVRSVLPQVAGDHDVRGVNVAAMVPSMCAVDGDGTPLTPGLLYGDARGRTDRVFEGPGNAGELFGFLKWCAREAPQAAGYWPAQAVANHALCGEGAIDVITAMSGMPMFDGAQWDPEMLAEAGVPASKLPRVVGDRDAVGKVGEAVVGGGAIDAFGEQMVAGADHEGDVLVILGATLIAWAVIPEWVEYPGLWTIPHTAPGKILTGGASNAGGLFMDWVLRLAGEAGDPAQPDRVPVFLPYVRGERVPLHDPFRRAAVHDLDLTHGAAAVRRAACEASGFVVRHMLDVAGLSPRRIVATGGGTRNAEWIQALADCTGLPVDVVAVPEGGALGAAFMARVIAGLEESMSDAARWAATSHRVEPDPAWSAATTERYGRFRELTAAE